MGLAVKQAAIAEPSQSEPQSAVRPCSEGVQFDEGQFKAFVVMHMQRVGDLAHRLGIPRHVAEEMLQESFARLWQERRSVDASRWDGWLWNALIFRRLVYFRSVRRAGKYELALIDLLERWQEHAPPDLVAYLGQCDRDLCALVESLAPPRRDVASLYLLEELPMNEVAARLGIPENTAKDRWRLAQIDMRAAWERDRAKERSRLGFASLLAKLSAVFLALWRRIVGREQRTGRLLAAAALALPFTPLSTATARTADSAGAPMVLVPTTQRVAAQPHAPATVLTAAPAPMAPDQQVPTRSRLPFRKMAIAHTWLSSAAALVRRGQHETARDLVLLYRLRFPDNPLPDQHQQLAADLSLP